MSQYRSFTIVILLLLGVGTGLLATARFAKSDEVINPYEPLQELQESIDILTEEQKLLQEKIAREREEVQDLEGLIVSGPRKQTLDELKRDAGLTEVTGTGIKVVLDDRALSSTTAVSPTAVCHAADLRDIVNILRVAGANAIAINNQRIIDRTAIICVGQTVLVNNVRMLPPFTILAVTDENPDTLITYLETEKFLPDLITRIETGEVILNITQQEEITIPVYKGNLETKFIAQ